VVDVNLRMLPFVRATHLGSRARVGTTPYMTTLVATSFDPAIKGSLRKLALTFCVRASVDDLARGAVRLAIMGRARPCCACSTLAVASLRDACRAHQ
jgi:hypothetical protein